LQWTVPVGLPPPHKFGMIQPPTRIDAESKGRQHAEEILGSNFTPPLLFQLHHSREGISTGATSACDCDDSSIEVNCTDEVSHRTSIEDVVTCFVQIPWLKIETLRHALETPGGTCFVQTPWLKIETLRHALLRLLVGHALSKPHQQMISPNPIRLGFGPNPFHSGWMPCR